MMVKGTKNCIIMKIISAVLSLIVAATTANALLNKCHDCYRVDDDVVTAKCCSSLGYGKMYDDQCHYIYGGSAAADPFTACCVNNKCENVA